MGNFMNDSVVTEQEDGVKKAIEFLSKKYGIDIHKTSIGHKECPKNDCTILNDFTTTNLAGHKEVGFTSCPGDSLFTIVGDIRKTETASVGRTIVINPSYSSIKLASIEPYVSTIKNLNK